MAHDVTTVDAEQTLQSLRLFASARHECGYFSERPAATIFTDPQTPMSTALYSRLIEHGFRRSGPYVYRPHCPNCNDCIPVRVPVAQFRPSRSQLRTWRDNADVVVSCPAGPSADEHRALYRRYIRARHAGGAMDEPHLSDPLTVFSSPWSDTLYYEFHAQQRLLAVAVTDRLDDALSAVYTFFDPDERRRGLGVFAVLWQIHEARRLGLQWLYLGYWIKACRKMAYKGQYRPIEIYRAGRWRPLDEPLENSCFLP